MDAASLPAESPAESTVDLTAEYSTPLLETLFSGRARRFRPLGSLIYGIVGITVFTMMVSVFAGGFLAWADDVVNSHVTFICYFLIAAAVYPTATMTLQFFASLRLPLSIRILLVYVAVFAFLRAITFGIQVPVTGSAVLVCAGICIGGLIQQWFNGWYALSWGQKAEPPGKISIAALLDLTAAIAITMGLASAAEIDPGRLSFLFLPWLILAPIGMQGWGRLTSLCAGRRDRDLGFAIWMTGSAVWGCLIFLILVLAGSGSPFVLFGFLIGPAVVFVAHLTTVAPIAWLRACGWKFERVEPVSTKSAQTDATFSSSI